MQQMSARSILIECATIAMPAAKCTICIRGMMDFVDNEMNGVMKWVICEKCIKCASKVHKCIIAWNVDSISTIWQILKIINKYLLIIMSY